MSEVACPFCGEKDFDLIGLKNHFLNGWCEVFADTPRDDRKTANHAYGSGDHK